MPWLTPNDFGEGDTCRPLFIPDTSEWLAIVSGAILDLTKKFNWQEFGTLTPDECAERMQEMLSAYYEGVCNDCVLPDDIPVLRLDETGQVQQYSGGEWVTPFGDYALPSTPEREESTEAERICAAATNAVNVLAMLYEELSDNFQAELNVSQAQVNFTGIVSGALAAAFGLVTVPLITLLLVAFNAMYELTEFLTDDLWDTEFTQKLICIFIDCATGTGDVVTFDYQCIIDQLYAGTDLLDVTVTEQRLFLQVATIMGFLGIEAINAAGATTDIETPECEFCPGMYDFDFVANGQQSWLVVLSKGQWDATGSFFELKCAGGAGSLAECRIERGLAFSSTFYRVEMDCVVIGAGIEEFNFFVDSGSGVTLAHSFGGSGAGTFTLGGDITPVASDYLRIDVADSNGCGSTDCQILALRFFFT